VKTLMLAALLLSSPALAMTEDEYAVCLTGNTVIALSNQAPDALNPLYDSLKAAHSLCEAPKVSEDRLREIDNYVEDVVEQAIAGE